MRFLLMIAVSLCATTSVQAAVVELNGANKTYIPDSYLGCPLSTFQEDDFQYCETPLDLGLGFLTDWPSFAQNQTDFIRPYYAPFDAISATLFVSHRIYRASPNAKTDGDNQDEWEADSTVGNVGVRVDGVVEGKGLVVSKTFKTGTSALVQLSFGEEFHDVTGLSFSLIIEGADDQYDDNGEQLNKYLYKGIAAYDYLSPGQIWCDESCADISLKSLKVSYEPAPAPVPLPATGAMLASVFAVLAALRRRQRKAV